MVIAAVAASAVVAVDVSVTTVRLRAGSAAALVVVMQVKNRLLATGALQIAVALPETAMTVARPFRAVLHHRATTTQTDPVSTTAARAPMTVALATAADLRSATTVAAIAALAVAQMVFRLHRVVTLPTASPLLPGLLAKCLCRAMRKSGLHVLHVKSFPGL